MRRAGDRYRFRLDDAETLYPDPASRYQPEGPHGPSVIVDPRRSRGPMRLAGVSLDGQVLYELHVGTFTRAGTWAAAAGELAELARSASPCIEVMPVAEFEGRFGWGYDGVDLFAPSHLYGTPDDFRASSIAPIAPGLGVILDVVYNHLGPVGNYLRAFSPAYFTDRYENEWGEAINFDGADARTGPRILRRQRRILDRGIPPRRPAPRCHAADLRRVGRAHPHGDRAAARACRGADAPSTSWPRTSRRTRVWSGRSTRAGTGSTRCGTTISITARWWR